MAIEAVVFDIGNVLLEWHPEKYYDEVYGEDRRKALFAEVDLHDMNERVDLGHPFKETIYAEAEKHPEWATEIRDWHDNWIKLASPVIWHSVRLLRALRLNMTPVFTLTNFGVESYAYAQTQFDFLNEFDREYVSGRMKMIKPNAEIYEAVEKDCGIAPENLIFADDRADNIAMAASRGWKTHQFTEPQGWADRLVSEGLLTAKEAT